MPEQIVQSFYNGDLKLSLPPVVVAITSDCPRIRHGIR